MHRLEKLRLSENNLDAAAIEQLVMGAWPSLKDLRLDDNLLDDDALKLLAQGQWQLERLWLGDNNTSATGIQHLTEGQWPLSNLRLGESDVSAATWSILSLDAAYLPASPATLWSTAATRVPRSLQWVAGHEEVWPDLNFVCFTSTNTSRRQDGSRPEHVV